MSINPLMLAAIKALSYSDKHLIKNYKVERKIDEWIHPNLFKAFYKIGDHYITKEHNRIPIRLFFPSEEGLYPLLIFFHGGGFVKGTIDSYSQVCMNLAKLTKHIVLSVDYRLAPEHPFPQGLEDCYEVVKEVFKHLDLFRIKPKDITLIGDSAGGNLAAAVSLMARDKGDFKIHRQVLIYPLLFNDHSKHCPYPSVRENGTDYLLTTKRIRHYMKLYIKDRGDLQNPYLAPLLAKTLDNQPKTLIITAEYDPLRDEAEDYGRRLKEDGNEVKIHRMVDTIHGYFSLPLAFDTVKETYTLINDFLIGD